MVCLKLPKEAEGFFMSGLLRATCSSGNSVATEVQRKKSSLHQEMCVCMLVMYMYV